MIFFIETGRLIFSGSIQVLFDIQINTEQAKIDVQMAEQFQANTSRLWETGCQTSAGCQTADYGGYNLDNLDEFLSKPAVLVRKVLMDNNVKQVIDQQLQTIAEKNNRSAIGTISKDFYPEIYAFFDQGKNFEKYCQDNCLDNEILIMRGVYKEFPER